MLAPAFALMLAIAAPAAAQSASTLTAVTMFTANVDRKWPADEREPAVTGEALRLFAVAAQAVADEHDVNSGKLRGKLEDFDEARTALEQAAPTAGDRAEAAREALIKGREMAEALADALDRKDPATRQRLSELKRSSDDFDKRKDVRQQLEILERYFGQAGELMRSMIDASTTTD